MSTPAFQSPKRNNRTFDKSFLATCDETIKEFYFLWQSKCRADRLPSRRDIDPAEMVRLLPYIMLIDIIRPGPQFKYRLVGTGEANHRGFDPTGKTLEEAYSGLDGAFAVRFIPHCDNYHEGRHYLDQSLCRLNGPILRV